ncbi:hypothetical protein M431DRAFT_542672 [Trichoderma harzianum CBS 226.95]|uniref:Uncharacterized protein n=1 Tax=Trichoderma harzianum CBS 226.95 TaxID=983964 RepID=A0A2T3ZXK2_TRIHA|nr:hypothetical protein M431DRAFT_542672 [Trichoderma harzianum CBS 226.95]PTB49539.1 hypothetical protein M431DRAFT_542672 [Trichoderma harzianum CBS 226.95]
MSLAEFASEALLCYYPANCWACIHMTKWRSFLARTGIEAAGQHSPMCTGRCGRVFPLSFFGDPIQGRTAVRISDGGPDLHRGTDLSILYTPTCLQSRKFRGGCVGKDREEATWNRYLRGYQAPFSESAPQVFTLIVQPYMYTAYMYIVLSASKMCIHEAALSGYTSLPQQPLFATFLL